MNNLTLDWKKYSGLARQAAAEGCVLLRNENHTLPICPGDTVSVFGRIQLNYYRSGTGSGGMVNAPYVRSILDGLLAYKDQKISLYEPLLETYKSWEKSHPFDSGNGWGTEPWSQKEMPLDETLIRSAAEHSSLALILIGRTAGEDRDNTAQAGSYYLTDTELDMLWKVCAVFPRTAVVLNTGNLLSMEWVDEVRPGAVLCAWQGGMEGGMGAADVLCGAVSPCGKLSDTIARSIEDYPSVRNFGSQSANFYQEDIYVGYRYFETFAPEKVLWPFGFGLSYTTFSLNTKLVLPDEPSLSEEEAKIGVSVTVRNTGSRPGKEVVQVYFQPPQGRLGKPLRALCAFEKTKELAPGESVTLTLRIPLNSLASYDDSGASGHRSCWVLEAGSYTFYTGTDVRSAAPAGSLQLPETIVTEACSEALAPVIPFTRFCPSPLPEGSAEEGPLSLSSEPVPLRTVSPSKRRIEHLPKALPFTGDLGYRLRDVSNGRVSLEEFLAQIPDSDLSDLVRGEGMCSPKVTPGTAAAFGGITDALQGFGFPACCCSDGPSGIRMDCGTSAFSLPNGTLLACTFNLPLVTELFAMEGLELYSNKIDALLGPGINIHRCPLNGRNFEYHSEDPYLTGQMAVAQITGMNRFGISGTLKHFCANNQEYCRHSADSILSERALREIYLKPFEIAVKSGQTRSIMTTYGPVNGIWTAGNYDLNTTILRGEWGYRGLVMTDWWAEINDEGAPASRTNLAAMIRAQNDLYMVTQDSHKYRDNLRKSLSAGSLTRAELVRSAANICRFVLASPAMQRELGTFRDILHAHAPEDLSLSDEQKLEAFTVKEDTLLSLEGRPTEAGSSFTIALSFEQEGTYLFSLKASSTGSELAQTSVTISADGTVLGTFTYKGSTKAAVSCEHGMRGTLHYLKFYFAQSGLLLHSLQIRFIRPL